MTQFIFSSTFEVVVAVLIILGFVFEDKLVDFEERLFASIKRKLFARRNKATIIHHSKMYCDNKSHCA